MKGWPTHDDRLLALPGDLASIFEKRPNCLISTMLPVPSQITRHFSLDPTAAWASSQCAGLTYGGDGDGDGDGDEELVMRRMMVMVMVMMVVMTMRMKRERERDREAG